MKAVPTSIVLPVETVTTGTSVSLSLIVTESPTATLVTLFRVNVVVPIPAVLHTYIAVSNTSVVLDEEAEFTKIS